MYDYKIYIDQRALLDFLIRNFVFLCFFGISVIVYLLPDFENNKVIILSILCILVVVYVCIRYREENDIQVRKL
jgi:hypothetical protein